MGYVERADGTVQAVVADGPFVAVLREGDVFQDQYRVAKVTRTLVEIEKQPATAAPEVAELAAPPAPKTEVAAIQQPASDPGPRAPLQPIARPEPQSKLSSLRIERKAASKSLLNKGEGLPQQQSSQELAETPGSSRSPGPAKPGGSAPAPAQAPDRATRTLKPLGYVEWAGGRQQAVVEDEGEIYLVSEGEVFAGRFRALRVTPSSVEVVEGLSPPARASPTELSAFGQSAGQPLAEVAHSPPPQRAAERVGQKRQEVVDSAPAESIRGRSVSRSSPAVSLPTLGYVERQDGEVQAIVDDGDGVRIVRPGDVIAGKYLALSVSPSSVEVGSVADASTPSSSGGGAEERGSKASEVLAAAGEPTLGRQAERPGGRRKIQAEAARRAIPPVEASGSDSVAAATGTPLGYVEMADGRVQMIVAKGDGVDLVHDGFKSREIEGGDRQPVVIASHSPPGVRSEAAGGREEGQEASESASDLAYMVTHVRSPRFNFDLYVRLPDNRSD